MVNGLINATGRKPNVVAGKPQKPLMQASIDRTGSKKPIVIGDRLDTDILGANNVGIDSLLVFSGVTSIAELINAVPNERPTYIAWDATGISNSHQGVAIETGEVSLGGFRATADGLSGSGDSLDAIRVSAVAAWEGICQATVLINDLAGRGLAVNTPDRKGN